MTNNNISNVIMILIMCDNINININDSNIM